MAGFTEKGVVRGIFFPQGVAEKFSRGPFWGHIPTNPKYWSTPWEGGEANHIVNGCFGERTHFLIKEPK